MIRLTALIAVLGFSLGQAHAAEETATPIGAEDVFESETATPGWQAGSFTVHADVTLRGGYDDNLALTETPVSSPFAEARAEARAWRAAGDSWIEAKAYAAYTHVTDAGMYSHADYGASLAAQAELSPYVRIRASVGLDAGEELSGDRGVILCCAFDPYIDYARYMRVPLTAALVFDNGALFGGLSIDAVYGRYGDRMTLGGVSVAQDFRTGWTGEVTGRAGYRFTPDMGVFIAAAYGAQRYKDPTADSDGWRVTAGLDLNVTRLIKGSLFAGYAVQRFDAGGEARGLTYGAALTWYPTPLMTVSLEAGRSFGASLVSIDPAVEIEGERTDSISASLAYTPLRSLILRAEGRWERSTSVASGEAEDTLGFGLEAEYALGPGLTLGAAYDYEKLTSLEAGDAKRQVFSLSARAGY